VPQDLSKKDFDHTKVFSLESAMQHREEVTEYLKYDVISLRELYRRFSRAMYDEFSIDVNRCVTLSQYAYKAWASTQPALSNICLARRGKEEDDDRAAYYGGRVLPQRKVYQSPDLKNADPRDLEFNRLAYDSINDYLVCLDVNSLYPSVQKSGVYAYGTSRYWSGDELDADPQLLDQLNLLSPVGGELLARSMLCVDVECPRDLFTAFLFERTDAGLKQTLLPKQAQWYWGCELRRAIILGYKIVRVREIKEFQHTGDLFSAYVDKCWDGRKRNPKPSIKNACYKLMMNALTGKFAQRTNQTNVAIFTTNGKLSKNQKGEFYDLLTRATDFEPFFNEGGHNHAIMLEYEADNLEPAQPIILSAQILAKSRVYMSEVMSAVNAYHDPKMAIYYTDTDSIVIHHSAIDILRHGNYIGDELGQLSCDLVERPGAFAKIVRAAWAAPKGPYSLVYVEPTDIGGDMLKEKIRSKGIPMPSGSKGVYQYGERIESVWSEGELNSCDRMLQWIDRPDKHLCPSELIGRRLFLFRDFQEESVFFAKHFNIDIIEKAMNREGELFAFFGGMKRSLGSSSSGQPTSIEPTVNVRMACRLDWWKDKSGRRTYQNEEGNDAALTVPAGYQEDGARVDLNYIDWLQLGVEQLFGAV
jgi:hypothetical protein